MNTILKDFNTQFIENTQQYLEFSSKYEIHKHKIINDELTINEIMQISLAMTELNIKLQNINYKLNNNIDMSMSMDDTYTSDNMPISNIDLHTQLFRLRPRPIPINTPIDTIAPIPIPIPIPKPRPRQPTITPSLTTPTLTPRTTLTTENLNPDNIDFEPDNTNIQFRKKYNNTMKELIACFLYAFMKNDKDSILNSKTFMSAPQSTNNSIYNNTVINNNCDDLD